jgi:hypothetical protein
VEELASLSLAQLVMGVAGLFVVVAVALFLWRVLKRTIGGCISMGIGCSVLIIGLVAIGLYFAPRLGVSSFDDIIRLIGS